MTTTNISPSLIVVEVLRGDNYDDWSACMKSYMLAQDLWDFIEPPGLQEGDQEVDSKPIDHQESDSKALRRKNAAALHAIQISCAPYILSKIRSITSAKVAWDTLANMQKLQVTTAEPPQLSRMNAGLDRWRELYKHAHEGNWEATKRFLDLHPEAKNVKITPVGETALHVAIAAGNVKLVEKLVELMSPEDLEIAEQAGCSALSYAAMQGITKMAKCMIIKNKKLVNLPNGGGCIPVVVSCLGNHKDMTHYLYSVTPAELLCEDSGNHGSLLLQFSIASEMFDIALDLLQRFPSLATALDKIWKLNAVTQLSFLPDRFHSGSRLAFWQRWIYSCIHIGPPIPFSDQMLQGTISSSLFDTRLIFVLITIEAI
nr:uncharacterized protein LOC118030468 [Populus alba]